MNCRHAGDPAVGLIRYAHPFLHHDIRHVSYPAVVKPSSYPKRLQL
jgi:hypothetical protein